MSIEPRDLHAGIVNHAFMRDDDVGDRAAPRLEATRSPRVQQQITGRCVQCSMERHACVQRSDLVDACRRVDARCDQRDACASNLASADARATARRQRLRRAELERSGNRRGLAFHRHKHHDVARRVGKWRQLVGRLGHTQIGIATSRIGSVHSRPSSLVSRSASAARAESEPWLMSTRPGLFSNEPNHFIRSS